MILRKLGLFLSGMVLLTSATCVMARQSCNVNTPSSTPVQRFNDHANGTLTDTRTGLMWKTCLEGQEGNDCAGTPRRMSWEQAVTAAELVNGDRFAGNSGWRLPTLAELRGIVDKRCTSPSINLEVFPRMRAVALWSNDQADPRAWSVEFAKGKSHKIFKGAGNYVRLVRDSR